ncbi:MAG: hypothetical protein JKX80_02180 [Candidatus Pacebacteria bacterium]|nr:hypothetical protein [Candidatus Paceibacterota bacterium]
MSITIRTTIYVFVGLLLIVVLFAVVARAQTTLSTNVTVGGGTHVAGTLSKGSGTFAIDHPLDPKNKLLFHSFLESPDVKNIYDGIAKLDRNGRAEIILPDYFLTLNKDLRYLSTSIGESMPGLYVEREVEFQKFWLGLIKRPTFVIAGGTPGGTISWQLTGIRKDVFITENPIIVEVEKGPDQLIDKGECLFKPLCE